MSKKGKYHHEEPPYLPIWNSVSDLTLLQRSNEFLYSNLGRLNGGGKVCDYLRLFIIRNHSRRSPQTTARAYNQHPKKFRGKQ
jgi:hypothetical protein